jgi:hypothetical protein
MALRVSVILMVASTSHFHSGMKKSTSVLHFFWVVLLTTGSAFLKERLFGLSNPQGNHGESIKEAHFHVDNTPSVSILDSLS